jgi:hypothetical protein
MYFKFYEGNFIVYSIYSNVNFENSESNLYCKINIIKIKRLNFYAFKHLWFYMFTFLNAFLSMKY